MNARPGLFRLLLTATLLTGLNACGGTMDDLEAYANEVKARKSGEVDPIPQIVPYAPFTYTANARRDPFTALVFARPDTSDSGIKPDLNRNREPLEEYPLDGLRMVGTIFMQSGRYALVRSPDGVIHRVTIGNYLGQNFGKIVGINDSDVQMVELLPDGFGGYMEQAASIALTQD